MSEPRQFRLWASGCCHVGTDLRRRRESLAEAIRHSERDFGWDAAVHLGDFSGTQAPPDDAEGREVVRQFRTLRKHRREHVYCLVGNHDATDEPLQWWFRKWLDPTGEHTEHSGVDPRRRPYPVEGTWERYAFRVGNLLWLMMGDRNDGGPPAGRGTRGGYPAGAVTAETFAWWRRTVEEHPYDIIVSCHHHMLKATAVASGEWEGFRRDKQGRWRGEYHGYFADGAPKGASYLYFVGGKPDAQAFERYLAANPDAIDRVRVQCYLHTAAHAPQGWHAPAERTLPLTKPFQLD